MYWFLLVLYVLVSMLLLVVVLLQQGKGGDIAAAFGGASSQTAFGARAGATVLTRATAVLGTLFLLGALVLSIVGRTQGGGSVVTGVDGPSTPTQAAPALPMPAPAPSTTPANPPATAPAAPPAGSNAAPATPPAGSTPPPATPPAPKHVGDAAHFPSTDLHGDRARSAELCPLLA
jgi:preprotein translocase subunit SecG